MQHRAQLYTHTHVVGNRSVSGLRGPGCLLDAYARGSRHEGGIVALSGKRPLQVQSSVRVRYSETDQMGVVYYANYLVWFEIGRTDYCRQMGFAYKAMEEEDGLFISVAEVKCRYRAPAHYDDELTVRTCLQSLRKRVLVFGYEICRENGDEILATGESVHVITNRDGRPRTLPDKYYRLFAKALKANS